MTRKDFQLIADVINGQYGEWVFVADSTVKEQHEVLARKFATVLATTNPRFDRDRFIAAATR